MTEREQPSGLSDTSAAYWCEVASSYLLTPKQWEVLDMVCHEMDDLERAVAVADAPGASAGQQEQADHLRRDLAASRQQLALNRTPRRLHPKGTP